MATTLVESILRFVDPPLVCYKLYLNEKFEKNIRIATISPGETEATLVESHDGLSRAAVVLGTHVFGKQINQNTATYLLFDPPTTSFNHKRSKMH